MRALKHSMHCMLCPCFIAHFCYVPCLFLCGSTELSQCKNSHSYSFPDGKTAAFRLIWLIKMDHVRLFSKLAEFNAHYRLVDD